MRLAKHFQHVFIDWFFNDLQLNTSVSFKIIVNLEKHSLFSNSLSLSLIQTCVVLLKSGDSFLSNLPTSLSIVFVVSDSF